MRDRGPLIVGGAVIGLLILLVAVGNTDEPKVKRVQRSAQPVAPVQIQKCLNGQCDRPYMFQEVKPLVNTPLAKVPGTSVIHKKVVVPVQKKLDQKYAEKNCQTCQTGKCSTCNQIPIAAPETAQKVNDNSTPKVTLQIKASTAVKRAPQNTVQGNWVPVAPPLSQHPNEVYWRKHGYYPNQTVKRYYSAPVNSESDDYRPRRFFFRRR